MKQLRVAILALGLIFSFSAVTPVQAQGVWGACTGVENEICADDEEATDIVKNLVNTFLFVIGLLSVIMIIHSGLKYTTSRGDAEAVKSAKNTLLYAVVGLIVAISAYAIVNFVVTAFDTSTGEAGNQTGSEARDEAGNITPQSTPNSNVRGSVVDQ